MIREVKEEIGLQLEKTEFELLGKFWRHEVHQEDFIENELDYIYIVRKYVDLSDIKIQKEEVEDIAWIEIKDFKDMILNGKVVKRKQVWDKLFKYLELKI